MTLSWTGRDECKLCVCLDNIEELCPPCREQYDYELDKFPLED